MIICGDGHTTNEALQDAMRKYEEFVSPETNSWIAHKEWSLRENLPDDHRVHLELTVVIQLPSTARGATTISSAA